MIRFLAQFVWPAITGRLTCPLLVTTGVHTTLLVGLGLLVAAAARSPHSSVPLAVGMLPDAGAGGELDGSPISVAAAAGDGAGRDAEDDALDSDFAGDDVGASPADGPWFDLESQNSLDLWGALANAGSTHGQGAHAATSGTGKGTGHAGGGQAPGTGETAGTGAKTGTGAGGLGSSFFGLRSYGKKVVFVVDVSGSMRGRRIRRAQLELKHTLEALKTSQKFFVVFFSDGALPMPAQALVWANQTNLQQAWDFVRQIECGGGTNPLPALLMALQLKPDAIYLLTDGKFPPQVVWALAEAQPVEKVPIYTIGFATKKAERLLKAIATDAGGEYQFVP